MGAFFKYNSVLPLVKKILQISICSLYMAWLSQEEKQCDKMSLVFSCFLMLSIYLLFKGSYLQIWFGSIFLQNVQSSENFIDNAGISANILHVPGKIL
jgi:hypothetical protein